MKDKCGVIYQIQCECDKTYTGETGRAFGIRQNEHRCSILRNDSSSSKLAEHCNEFLHWPKFDESKILATGSSRFVRRIKEDIVRDKEGERSINKNRAINLKGQVRDMVAIGRLTM